MSAAESVLALAVALLARLGFPLHPVAADAPEPSPHPVPLVAMASPWLPSLSLGIPGRYTPQTGGEP
jgi:hypothetical protein